jgi:hypothetical protein
MPTTRRSFLQMALAPAAVSVLGCREVQGAPAIIKQELTPQLFGATGGDAVADTLGWNRAIAAAAESGRPVLAKGTYVLRVPSTTTWNWRKRANSPSHVAVMLRSGVQVLGNNAEILIGKPERPPTESEHHFIFGTGLNMKQGTLKDISFDGLNIDFREEFGVIHRPTYAFGIVGVDNFKRENMVICSTGAIGGRGLLAENTRGRSDRNLKMSNIEQGIYTHYEYGVTMQDIDMDRFNEGLDFDGPAWDVNLSRLKFRNAYREGQCIDTGGGARWTISDVDAENTGAIVFIYNKSISWPTYDGWYNADDGEGHERVTPNFVVPEKFTVKGVRGRNVGKGLGEGKGAGKEEVLRVGSYRVRGNHTDFPGKVVPSPRDITIEDWVLDGTYRIGVSDCENLTMRNITMNDVKAPDDPQVGAALVLREAAAELGGSVTGMVSDIRIKHCDGMGVSIVAGAGLKLRDIKIDGFNQADGINTRTALRIRHRVGGNTSLAQVDNLTAQGGQAGDPAQDIAAIEPEASIKAGKNANKNKADKQQRKDKKQKLKPQKVPVDY